MNGLRIILDGSCIFHKDYLTFYDRDWNSNSGTDFGITCGKCSMKRLTDVVIKIGIHEISNMNF